VIHRGDHNVPWRFPVAIGKIGYLLDQIIGEAKHLGLFSW
jgi:hypothetical protein